MHMLSQTIVNKINKITIIKSIKLCITYIYHSQIRFITLIKYYLLRLPEDLNKMKRCLMIIIEESSLNLMIAVFGMIANSVFNLFQ